MKKVNNIKQEYLTELLTELGIDVDDFEQKRRKMKP